MKRLLNYAVSHLGEEIIAYKPPGFSLMYHLLNESPMLELCLSLLEEGVKQLDTYAAFPGVCPQVPVQNSSAMYLL